MRYLVITLLFLGACQMSPKPPASDLSSDLTSNPGWASVFQTFTSESATSINILRPRLTELHYVLTTDDGPIESFQWGQGQVLKPVKSTTGPSIHWRVDRVFIKGLQPNKNYRLLLVKQRGYRVVDWRRFQTLPLSQKKVRFAMGSCMSDSHDFEHVRSRIWNKMASTNPDFVMLLGDQVYVDDFDFVKRNEATEFDLWTRYIDSFRKIPLFHLRDLKPIYAVWDDHDYGSNNADKTFSGKKAAQKVFTSFFGGEPLPGVIDLESQGVYFSFKGFGQKFLFMDDRYFREPTDKPYAQWGEAQHRWFRKQLTASEAPIWLANGGQFFSEATVVTVESGEKKQVNESFKDDHPSHFQSLLSDIKKAKVPVVFLSGDIHYSEIAKVEKPLLGYETYEITSSPIHSYIYRSPTGEESWLKNSRRILAIKDHNFLVVDAGVKGQGLDIKVTSLGVKTEKPYFEKELKVAP